MSIPKEPRQLMINLMYLVLTAMLALNVSAEIINAFFMLDKGIKHTNEIVDRSTDETIKNMKETVKKKVDLKPIAEAAGRVPALIDPLLKKVDDLRVAIADEGGIWIYEGEYHGESQSAREAKLKKQGFTNFKPTKEKKMDGKPVDKKNKDITQRVLVDEKGAVALKDLVNETRDKLLKVVDDIVALNKEKEMPGVKFTETAIKKIKEDLVLEHIDDEHGPWADLEKSWEQYVFGYMPIAACYPLFRKYQNDAKNAAAQIVNFLSANMGNKILTYDKFDVFSSSKKPYILMGETYEAEIALGAFSSEAEFSVKVGGSNLTVEDGKAKYSATPRSVGTQSYTAQITVKNPLTGKTETFDKEFQFEVGVSTATVSADKMNVFYVGVPNPISVAAAGVSSNAIAVSASGGGAKLTRVANGKYTVTCTKPTPPNSPCKVTVSDTEKNKVVGSYPFRVKRIPNPVAKLTNNKTDGKVRSGEMRAQRGLMAILENFDFDAKCQIQGFTMYYTPPRADPVEIINQGGTFRGQALQAIQNAKPGVSYQFINVKGRCPGDTAGRKLNGLAFQVR